MTEPKEEIASLQIVHSLFEHLQGSELAFSGLALSLKTCSAPVTRTFHDLFDPTDRLANDGTVDEDEETTKRATTSSVPTSGEKPQLLSIGYGYDNKTKQVKRVTPLTTKTGEPVRVKEGSSVFSVPANATRYYSSKTFKQVEKYSNGRRTSQVGGITGGIDVKVLGLVEANLKGHLSQKDSTFDQKALLCEVHEVGIATLILENLVKHPLSSEFEQDLSKLPSKFDKDMGTEKFFIFFARWGTHVVAEQDLGGIAKILYGTKRNSDESEFSSGLNAELGGALVKKSGKVGGGGEMSSEADENVARSMQVLIVEGGNRMRAGMGVKEWSQSVEQNPCALEDKIKLFPYYDFLDDGDKRAALEKATAHYCCGEKGSKSWLDAINPFKYFFKKLANNDK